MVSWGHTPRWPRLQLPQPTTAEAPGSLLQAALSSLRQDVSSTESSTQ